MEQREVEREIVEIVARARDEGWYEEDPGWRAVDARLELLGLAHR